MANAMNSWWARNKDPKNRADEEMWLRWEDSDDDDETSHKKKKKKRCRRE